MSKSTLSPDGPTQPTSLKNPCTGQPFHTVMTGNGISRASSETSRLSPNEYVINFTLANNDEAKAFSDYTANHIGESMALVVDGNVLNVPIIQAQLSTGGQFSGKFTQTEAQALAAAIAAGNVPYKLTSADVWQKNDSYLAVVKIPEGASDAKVQKTVEILKNRLTALGLVNDVQFLSDGLIGVKVSHRQDNDKDALVQALKTDFVEFVDFSRAADCNALMPGIGRNIETDAQHSAFGESN
jgi:hypothetical protein